MSDSKFLIPVPHVLVYFNGTTNYRLTPSDEYVTLPSAQAAVREALSAQKAEIERLTWNSNAAELLQHHVNAANAEITAQEAELEKLNRGLDIYISQYNSVFDQLQVAQTELEKLQAERNGAILRQVADARCINASQYIVHASTVEAAKEATNG